MTLELKNLVTCQIIRERKFLWMTPVYVEFQFSLWEAVLGNQGWCCLCILCHATKALASAPTHSYFLSSLSQMSAMTSLLQFPRVVLSFPDTFTVIFSAQLCDCMPSPCMSHVIYFISLIVTWEMYCFWNFTTVKLFEINSELLKGDLNDRQPLQMVKLT